MRKTLTRSICLVLGLCLIADPVTCHALSIPADVSHHAAAALPAYFTQQALTASCVFAPLRALTARVKEQWSRKAGMLRSATNNLRPDRRQTRDKQGSQSERWRNLRRPWRYPALRPAAGGMYWLYWLFKHLRSQRHLSFPWYERRWAASLENTLALSIGSVIGLLTRTGSWDQDLTRVALLTAGLFVAGHFADLVVGPILSQGRENRAQALRRSAIALAVLIPPAALLLAADVHKSSFVGAVLLFYGGHALVNWLRTNRNRHSPSWYTLKISHHLQVDEWNSALYWSREGLAWHPKDAILLSQRAAVRWRQAWKGIPELRLQRLGKALADIDAALAFAPADARIRGTRARILNDLERREEAVLELKEELRIKPTTVAYEKLADLLANLGRSEEAVDALNQGLARFPGDQTLLDRRRQFEVPPPAAEGSRDPSEYREHRGLAEQFARAQQWNDAWREAQRALESSFHLPVDYDFAARMAMQASQNLEAEALLTEGLQHFERHPTLLRLLGLALLAQRRLPEARAYLQAPEAMRASRPELTAGYLLYLDAVECVQRGDFLTAMEKAGQALVKAPREWIPKSAFWRALRHAGRGDLSRQFDENFQAAQAARRRASASRSVTPPGRSPLFRAG